MEHFGDLEPDRLSDNLKGENALDCLLYRSQNGSAWTSKGLLCSECP